MRACVVHNRRPEAKVAALQSIGSCCPHPLPPCRNCTTPGTCVGVGASRPCWRANQYSGGRVGPLPQTIFLDPGVPQTAAPDNSFPQTTSRCNGFPQHFPPDNGFPVYPKTCRTADAPRSLVLSPALPCGPRILHCPLPGLNPPAPARRGPPPRPVAIRTRLRRHSAAPAPVPLTKPPRRRRHPRPAWGQASGGAEDGQKDGEV